MNISAKFKDGTCVIELLPENNWEKHLLGSVAAGTGMMQAEVDYRPEGHFSHQIAEVVRVELRSTQGRG